MRRSVSSSPIGAALVLGLLVLTEATVGWKSVLAPRRELDPARLLAPAGLLLPSHLVWCARLKDRFPELVPAAALKTVLFHDLWNNLLPMRAGEAGFPLLLRRYGGLGFDRSVAADGAPAALVRQVEGPGGTRRRGASRNRGRGSDRGAPAAKGERARWLRRARGTPAAARRPASPAAGPHRS